MQIDLRTVSIKPIRQTFTHIADRIGPDKAASRYQEATLNVQADANFWAHVGPGSRDLRCLPVEDRDGRLVTFKDQQFYCAAYTTTRARMRETTEADFEFVERQRVGRDLRRRRKRTALDVLVPLRHVAMGANMNNSSICAATALR